MSAQRVPVGDDVEFDPRGAQRLAHQPRGQQTLGGVGQRVMPSRFDRSKPPMPPSASMRRIATLVSSLPDATSASSSTARLAAQPVPRVNREPNCRPVIVSFESASPHRHLYTQSRHRQAVIAKMIWEAQSSSARPRDAPVGVAERVQRGCNGGVLIHLHTLVVEG